MLCFDLLAISDAYVAVFSKDPVLLFFMKHRNVLESS